MADSEASAEVVFEGASSTTTTFPLFQLPAELWSRICREAVTFDDPIEIRVSDDVCIEEALRQPGIARTCKAARAETLHVYYASNDFHFRDLGSDFLGLAKWVKVTLATAQWDLVKTCTISSTAPYIREHLLGFCFGEKHPEIIARYDVKLVALEGENIGLDGVMRRFKLEIERKEKYKLLKAMLREERHSL